MHVRIYIENTQKSPKIRCGSYGYVLACEFRGELYTIDGHGQAEGTKNQTDLTACIEALGHMKKVSDIEIIGDLYWIACQAEYLTVWKKNGWINASGKEVKNKELWQLFMEKNEEHKITFTCCREHEFSGWIRRKLKEEYG